MSKWNSPSLLKELEMEDGQNSQQGQSSEKRKFERHLAGGRITIIPFTGGARHSRKEVSKGHLVDISRSGLRTKLNKDPMLNPGESVTLEVFGQGGIGNLHLKGRVVRIQNESGSTSMGIEFIELSKITERTLERLSIY